MTGRRPRVAFVVQRCGDDVAGGAERLCLDTARHCAAAWDAEILTTCARDTRTWANVYRPGTTAIGGIAARRFPVESERDVAVFDRMSARIAREPGTLEEQRAWMRAQGPDAPALTAYLARSGSAYDRIVFFSYLYASTYFGLPQVAERAVLVPLAHDEWMLALPLFDDLFERTAAFAFLSPEERALIERRFGSGIDARGDVVGAGIEAPPDADGARFRRTHGVDGELLVCVGRVEPAKGSEELLAHFVALQARDPRPRTLVLLGPLGMALPARNDVRALGQVDDRTKWDALAAADVVCVPSLYESLSLAALEAWAVGTPVLANGASAVLVGQCRRSNAGLWYANEDEFVELVRTRLFGRAAELGASGARFVAANYRWPDACARLAAVAGLPCSA